LGQHHLSEFWDAAGEERNCLVVMGRAENEELFLNIKFDNIPARRRPPNK
jgi:hypothetical protein